MSFSSQRSKVLDFSHFTAVDEMTFVSQLPGLASRVWILLEPFSWLLWIANFISYFAVIGTLYLLYRFYLKGYQNSSGRTSFRFIAMKVFSVLVNQCELDLKFLLLLDILISLSRLGVYINQLMAMFTFKYFCYRYKFEYKVFFIIYIVINNLEWCITCALHVN